MKYYQSSIFFAIKNTNWVIKYYFYVVFKDVNETYWTMMPYNKA